MFKITIGGKPVNYLKRVKHGAPAVIFASADWDVAKYGERTAKGWLNTCRKFFDNVEMIEV